MKANKHYVWGFQVLGESALLGFYKALFYKEQTCCLFSGSMFLRDNLLASLQLKKNRNWMEKNDSILPGILFILLEILQTIFIIVIQTWDNLDSLML